MASGYFSAILGLTDAALAAKSAALLVAPDPARIHVNDAAAISILGYIDLVAKGETLEHVGLVFPAYYTLWEREVWRTALNISISEFDDVEAVTLNYLIQKDVKKATTVLFVDVGATSVKAYAVTFSENRTATRRSYAIDKSAGGAYLSKSLIPLLRERAGVPQTTDAEDRRLFAAAERAKFELGESDSSTVIFEIAGVSRTATVNASDFQTGYLDSLVDAVVKVAVRASTGVMVDEVELIGGSSKLRVIDTALKKALNGKLVGHSLDPDFAIATGGAYALQFALNQSQLPPVNLSTPFSLHDVSFVQERDTLPL
jgi:molecular chaperone DnaK (HSP70)